MLFLGFAVVVRTRIMGTLQDNSRDADDARKTHDRNRTELGYAMESGNKDSDYRWTLSLYLSLVAIYL